MSKQKAWWEPEIVGPEVVARLRSDYPEQCSGLNDEEVLEHFEYSSKYATAWDHVGDAYDQFEKLADAYYELIKAIGLLLPITMACPPHDVSGRRMLDEAVAIIKKYKSPKEGDS